MSIFSDPPRPRPRSTTPPRSPSVFYWTPLPSQYTTRFLIPSPCPREDSGIRILRLIVSGLILLSFIVELVLGVVVWLFIDHFHHLFMTTLWVIYLGDSPLSISTCTSSVTLPYRPGGLPFNTDFLKLWTPRDTHWYRCYLEFGRIVNNFIVLRMWFLVRFPFQTGNGSYL